MGYPEEADAEQHVEAGHERRLDGLLDLRRKHRSHRDQSQMSLAKPLAYDS
jgi:hypothetical protein